MRGATFLELEVSLLLYSPFKTFKIMASNSESGHANNVANFKLLIDECSSFGSKYQPSNVDLSIGSMTSLWTSGNDAHVALTNALINSKTPIAARTTLFTPVNKLVTKTLNYFESTKASKQLKSNAKTIADRIRGAAKVDKQENPDDVSVSHQGFVQKQDYFRQLLELYKSDANYAPNEDELKIATLQTLSDEMKKSNDNIGTIIAPLGNALIARNKALYSPETGLVDVAQLSKDYVQGVYGASAPETKNVRKIKFKRPKK